MKRIGYDPQYHLAVSCDKELSREGVFSEVPQNAAVVGNSITDEIIGCAFLSGFTRLCIVISSDGITMRMCMVASFDQQGCVVLPVAVTIDDCKAVGNTLMVCVCGSVVNNPHVLSEIGKILPSASIYVCPVVEELAAVGAMARVFKLQPCRMLLGSDNVETIDAEYQEFDKKLDGDAYGRMAELVRGGLKPINDTRKPLGISPFYGRVIHHSFFEGSTLIMKRDDVDKFFPDIPISIKYYMATTVPVKVETNKFFSSQTGYNGETINLFVATDYIPDTSVFMRFYKTLSGKGFVFAGAPSSIVYKGYAPIFRADKAYRIQEKK